MSEILDRIISCQERMIAALDARDVAALESATAELENALIGIDSAGAVYASDGSRLDLALRQSNAARIRVNVLADWTRQRIDQIGEIRSGRSTTYGKNASF